MTTASHSRSSHSQTAIGFRSTPNNDPVNTSRRTALTGRRSPSRIAEIGEAVQGVHEKGSGAARRVEQGGAREVAAELPAVADRRRGLRQQAISVGCRESGGDEQLLERLIGDALDEPLRREEGAAVPTVVRGHERFERAPEHLRIDRGVAPGGRILAGREPVPGEQFPDDRAERFVGEGELAVASLERASGRRVRR